MTGWNVPEALSFAQTTGVVPASCSPDSVLPQMGKACEDMLCGDWQSQITQIAHSRELRKIDEIREWLLKKGTLITIFKVYIDLVFYKTGVYHRNASSFYVGGHCVEVIGFDDAQQAWLCKNSWTTRWGESGFFWIGYGECGIDGPMWAIDGFTSIYQTPPA